MVQKYLSTFVFVFNHATISFFLFNSLSLHDIAVCNYNGIHLHKHATHLFLLYVTYEYKVL